MSDKQFFDTNILVYAHDSSAGSKHAAAKALVENAWRDGSGVLSTQILQEFVVCLQRKVARPLDLDSIREAVKDYQSWDVVVNNTDSVLGALEMQQRYGISFWDALVVHAAESSGASVLYSEDLSDGRVLGTVRVVNPLLTGPARP
jgi:predicted nucleic acid-binding protein